LKRFIVTVEETISEDFEVYAENENEAFEITKNNYRNGTFVLQPGNVTFRQMTLMDEKEENATWRPF